jgi:hypothetical protein
VTGPKFTRVPGVSQPVISPRATVIQSLRDCYWEVVGETLSATTDRAMVLTINKFRSLFSVLDLDLDLDLDLNLNLDLFNRLIVYLIGD